MIIYNCHLCWNKITEPYSSHGDKAEVDALLVRPRRLLYFEDESHENEQRHHTRQRRNEHLRSFDLCIHC